MRAAALDVHFVEHCECDAVGVRHRLRTKGSREQAQNQKAVGAQGVGVEGGWCARGWGMNLNFTAAARLLLPKLIAAEGTRGGVGGGGVREQPRSSLNGEGNRGTREGENAEAVRAVEHVQLLQLLVVRGRVTCAGGESEGVAAVLRGCLEVTSVAGNVDNEGDSPSHLVA
jgi:hypothetical protein